MIALFDELRTRPERILTVLDLMDHPAVVKFLDEIGEARHHAGWLRVLKRVVYHADTFSQFHTAVLKAGHKHIVIDPSATTTKT